MNALTLIAIANAVLWSGIIVFLLFRLMGQSRAVEARLSRLEKEAPRDDMRAAP